MGDRPLTKSHARTRQWPIAFLRMYTGIFFLFHGGQKFLNDAFADGMVGFLQRNAENSPAFYQSFVEAVVMPNQTIFAALVTYGELAIGLLMLLGLATRYAAFAGAFLMLNFWMAKGQGLLEGSNHDVVWLVILLVLGLVPAGQIGGLDNGLSDRFRFLS